MSRPKSPAKRATVFGSAVDTAEDGCSKISGGGSGGTGARTLEEVVGSSRLPGRNQAGRPVGAGSAGHRMETDLPKDRAEAGSRTTPGADDGGKMTRTTREPSGALVPRGESGRVRRKRRTIRRARGRRNGTVQTLTSTIPGVSWMSTSAPAMTRLGTLQGRVRGELGARARRHRVIRRQEEQRERRLGLAPVRPRRTMCRRRPRRSQLGPRPPSFPRCPRAATSGDGKASPGPRVRP